MNPLEANRLSFEARQQFLDCLHQQDMTRVEAESTTGIVLRPYYSSGILRTVRTPPEPDQFEAYILNVIRHMKKLHKETYGYGSSKLILGSWLRERLRRLYEDYQPVVEYYMPTEKFPMTSVLECMEGHPPAMRMEPEERTVMRPTLQGLYVVEAEREGQDEYHIDVR